MTQDLKFLKMYAWCGAMTTMDIFIIFLRMKNVSGKEETVCITTYLIGDAHMIIYGWVLSHPHYSINKWRPPMIVAYKNYGYWM